jgi:cell division septum initiation protein DivIVA
MKKKFYYAVALLMICFVVSIGSAVSVSVIQAPPANLKIGDNIEVTLKLYIEGSFPMDHDIWFSTDLKDASVQAFDITDETIPPLTMQIVYEANPLVKSWILNGFILGGKDSHYAKILLSGKVPDVQGSSNITVIKVSEASGYNEIKSLYNISREIVNPALIDSKIQEVKTDIDALKSMIDEKGSAGVDISAATQKYNDAVNAWNQAKNLKSSDISSAQNALTQAGQLVIDGQNQLNIADAQNEIDTADHTLDQVNELVTYFTINRSISISDSRLVPITTKYDLASSKIGDAKTSLAQNDYIGAKAKAVEANNLANDAYNLSTSLKTEIGEGGIGLPGINPLFLILGIGIIVIGVVGYFAYRKFFHWDELG